MQDAYAVLSSGSTAQKLHNACYCLYTGSVPLTMLQGARRMLHTPSRHQLTVCMFNHLLQGQQLASTAPDRRLILLHLSCLRQSNIQQQSQHTQQRSKASHLVGLSVAFCLVHLTQNQPPPSQQ